MNNSQPTAVVQPPALERISNELGNTISNIETNLNNIGIKIHRIYFVSETENSTKTKESEPDDGSLTFKIRRSIDNLQEIEKKQLSY